LKVNFILLILNQILEYDWNKVHISLVVIHERYCECWLKEEPREVYMQHDLSY